MHREGENAPIPPVQSAKKTSQVGTNGGRGRGRHGGADRAIHHAFAASTAERAKEKCEQKNGGALRWGFGGRKMRQKLDLFLDRSISLISRVSATRQAVIA